MRIAMIGGTGKEGRGLALGWARAGEEVVIGSRSLEHAQQAAKEINAAVGREAASGLTNREAALSGHIVVLTVPYDAQEERLWDIRDEVRGKILVSVVVPIDTGNARRPREVPGGSAAEEAQTLLGPETRVVAAFQSISHDHLAKMGALDSDVLVCGDDAEARQEVIRLAALLGFRGLDAGPLRNARVVEGLTVLLLEINRRYKSRGTGIRVTGISEGDQVSG
ncbi:MAG TPA: NADPH-dependent F420 reductase [Candidatus Methylomirabilis sp.]